LTLLFFSHSPNHPIDAPPFILPDPLPRFQKRNKPKITETLSSPHFSTPTTVEDSNGIIEIDPTPRKRRNSSDQSGLTTRKREHSVNQQQPRQGPNKKRRLDDDDDDDDDDDEMIIPVDRERDNDVIVIE